MSTNKPLRGMRIASLALNLPGPAALRRLADLGARCTKVNPPAGDPMQHYTPTGYAELHAGVKALTLDLKAPEGQAALHRLLARTDILLTSFRPSALAKLGLDWKALHKRYPTLSLVQVVGVGGEELVDAQPPTERVGLGAAHAGVSGPFMGKPMMR